MPPWCNLVHHRGPHRKNRARTAWMVREMRRAACLNGAEKVSLAAFCCTPLILSGDEPDWATEHSRNLVKQPRLRQKPAVCGLLTPHYPSCFVKILKTLDPRWVGVKVLGGLKQAGCSGAGVISLPKGYKETLLTKFKSNLDRLVSIISTSQCKNPKWFSHCQEWQQSGIFQSWAKD